MGVSCVAIGGVITRSYDTPEWAKPVNLRKVTAGVLIGLSSAGIILFLSSAGALEKAELAAYDWRIRTAARPEAISKDIVLVDINETSIRDLAPFVGRWPWPRVVFGWLVNYLNRGPARVIAIDFAFA
jgi:adenylate cyclase